MLDMDYGFFPHVTRSNTTSKNAIAIINQLRKKDEYQIETFYVTRAYQTRHGNGFMSNENLDNSFIQINPDETNKNDGAQGVFRRAMLDFNQLRYALDCDEYHNHQDSVKRLVVTCLDHTNGEVMITKDGRELQIGLTPKMLGAILNISTIYTTNSDKGFSYEVPDTGVW
jgi:adenylosuccinate synthase